MKSNKTIGTRSTTNVIDSTFAHPAKAAFAQKVPFADAFEKIMKKMPINDDTNLKSAIQAIQRAFKEKFSKEQKAEFITYYQKRFKRTSSASASKNEKDEKDEKNEEQKPIKQIESKSDSKKKKEKKLENEVVNVDESLSESDSACFSDEFQKLQTPTEKKQSIVSTTKSPGKKFNDTNEKILRLTSKIQNCKKRMAKLIGKQKKLANRQQLEFCSQGTQQEVISSNVSEMSE